MKDSGVDWLGRLPEHWKVMPNRAVFTEVKERDRPNEDMLSVTITNGVVRQSFLLEDGSKKDGSNQDKSAYKFVRPGDVAYNKMRAWQGAVGVSEYEGIVSPAYVVQRPRESVLPRYAHYLLRTPAFAKEAERWSYGITSDMWSLRPEHFKMIYSCLPPLTEQIAIVRFLDYAERQVRRYIRVKLKLIALLEEHKQTIIDHAITRDFIDRIPLDVLGLPRPVESRNGWRSFSVGRLIQKRWLEVQDGNHGEVHPKASEFVEDGIPFLMAKDIRPHALNLATCAKISEDRARQLRIGFARAGDVLLTHKATIGQVGVVPESLPCPFVMLTPQVTYYRPLSVEVSSSYLLLYFQTSVFQEQLTLLALNQSTRPYVGLLEQRNLVVCLPTSDRQEQLVRRCAADTAPIVRALEHELREIALVREHRTRLIADVVTGKLDVREVAAGLGDGVDELRPLDESETEGGADDAADALSVEVREEAEA